MSFSSFLDSFKNPSTGDFDLAGSTNAGTWERNSGSSLTPQQADESWSSFSTRQDSYNNGDKNW